MDNEFWESLPKNTIINEFYCPYKELTQRETLEKVWKEKPELKQQYKEAKEKEYNKYKILWSNSDSQNKKPSSPIKHGYQKIK